MVGSPVAGHPEDVAAREALIDDFVLRRTAAGISQRSLSEALGVSQTSVWYLERRRPTNPRVATLVRYAGPCGLRLVLELSGLEDVEPPPAELAFTAAGFVGAALLARLRALRERAGLSQTQLAERGGWQWYSFAVIEYSDREPYLATLQRYARALGGRLDARWVVEQ